MRKISIENFLNTELVDYASYSTLRAIPSVIDGLKNSHRKVVYSVGKSLKKETKVSVLAGIVSVETQYLHGDISGAIVNLAKDYTGSNNLPLLKPNGNFGSRLIPENSATRYIFTEKQKYFDSIFLKEDENILIKQEFEGDEIEPLFYVPTIPLILVNGSKGLATGFANNILQRDTSNIIQYLKEFLNGKEADANLLNPAIKGFKGKITQDKENSLKYFISGNITITKKTIEVTELPLGYDLRGYIDFLDKLQEKGIIKKYDDKSDGEEFRFSITIDSKLLVKDKNYILEKLGLVKSFTENFTLLDENNQIKEFSSVKEVIDYYISIKLKYMTKRIEFLLARKEKLLNELKSILKFIQGVLENKIDLRKDNKNDLIKFCENANLVKKDNSYDYLFKISILNFTPKKVSDLEKSIEAVEIEINSLKKITPQQMWINDLEYLEKDLNLNEKKSKEFFDDF